MEGFTRPDGRAFNQLRPIAIRVDAYGYAEASVLIELGNTIVLASVTLQQGVPPFLKGQRVGWLTAEYAMLPAATMQRTQRESNQNSRNARSVEISRLIGRCLRPIVDLSIIGEKTIVIDCDVLQADGGTRVASITAASLALQLAGHRWLKQRLFEKDIVKEQIAAVSTGVVQGVACVDLAYQEDSQADADFNFVMTHSGKLLEVQGTCEKSPLSWEYFDQLKELAINGIESIFKVCHKEVFVSPLDRPEASGSRRHVSSVGDVNISKPTLFSLGNRLKSNA